MLIFGLTPFQPTLKVLSVLTDFMPLVSFHIPSIQLAITCSKLKIETLKQGVKYVQSYQ